MIDASKYRPCEVVANTTFKMAAEYDWVPNTRRGKVRLWLEATAVTPDGTELIGEKIFASANSPIDFDLTWGTGDPVGRPIVRLIDLKLQEAAIPGTQIRVRLRDPGESGEWPGPSSLLGPIAILTVVEGRLSDMQGDAGAAAAAAPVALRSAGAGQAVAATSQPEGERSTLGGQSVPDEFVGPTNKEVVQGGVIVFPYHVINTSGANTPVPAVSFELFTREKTTLFGGKVSDVQTNVKPGPHAFAAQIDANATPGEYIVWAILSPYNNLNGGGKSVMFKMKVKKKETNP